MIALIDILAKKSDGEAIVLVVFLVIVGVMVAVLSAAQKRKQQQAARNLRPAQTQARYWQPPPQVVAPPPAQDSASHNSVAQELAPEMVSLANARNLTPQAEKIAAAKSSLAGMLRKRSDVRRVLILNEVLGKPLALRRK